MAPMKKKPFKKAYKKKARAKQFKKPKVAYATPKMIYAVPLRAQDQTALITANPGATGAHETFEYSVSLSDIVSTELAAFTELYDEFKITGFKIQLRPRGNLAGTGSTGQNMGFQFYSVEDFTDLNPLSSVDAALEYANVKLHKSWKGMTRYIKCKVPKLTLDVNNNPVLKVENPGWLQLQPQIIAGTNYDNTIVAHLGCKLIFDYNLNDEDVIFDQFVTLYVQFKTKK